MKLDKQELAQLIENQHRVGHSQKPTRIWLSRQKRLMRKLNQEWLIMVGLEKRGE
jgi:hypothetical protein